VLIAPPGAIFRTTWPALSAKYVFPAPSIATPPCDPIDASVTILFAETLRIRF